MNDPSKAAVKAYIYSKYPPPSLFCIVSWGCAATKWLSVVLNSHPDIFCVHHQQFFWKLFADSADIGDVEYLRIVGMHGHGHVLAGDVHGISRFSVENLKKEFGEGFQCAAVVRHPMDRAFSAVRLWSEFEPAAKELGYLSGEPYAPVQHLLKTQEARLFAHALKLATAIREEVQVGPVFRCEDLTASAETVWKLIAHLSGGRIQPDAAITPFLFRSARINEHRALVNQRVEAWHRKLLDFIVDDASRQAYESLGYRFE